MKKKILKFFIPFMIHFFIGAILLFISIHVPNLDQLGALQALGGSSALYFFCFAGDTFEKKMTFYCFTYTTSFLCLSSKNFLGFFFCFLCLAYSIKQKKNLNNLFLFLFCYLHLTFRDLELIRMSAGLFSEITFLSLFTNPRSQQNRILFVLLCGVAGLQALSERPPEIHLFLEIIENVFLFPMQGSIILFFLFYSSSLTSHLGCSLLYFINGFLSLIFFRNSKKLAFSFLYFFLFLHFCLFVCVFIYIKQKNLPISTFASSCNKFLLEIKMELITILYIGVIYYFDFDATTKKFIVGMNSLLIQIIIILIYKKLFLFWGTKK